MNENELEYYELKEDKLEKIKIILESKKLEDLFKTIKVRTRVIIKSISKIGKANKIKLSRNKLVNPLIAKNYQEANQIEYLNRLISARVYNNKCLKRLKGIIHDPTCSIICEKCGGKTEKIPLNCKYIKYKDKYILLEHCSEWIIACKDCPFAYNSSLQPSNYSVGLR